MMTKKVIAILLAVCFVLTVTVGAASAKTTFKVKFTDQTNYANVNTQTGTFTTIFSPASTNLGLTTGFGASAGIAVVTATTSNVGVAQTNSA